MKTEDIYLDIAKYVETRFYNSNYELERPLLYMIIKNMLYT